LQWPLSTVAQARRLGESRGLGVRRSFATRWYTIGHICARAPACPPRAQHPPCSCTRAFALLPGPQPAQHASPFSCSFSGAEIRGPSLSCNLRTLLITPSHVGKRYNVSGRQPVVLPVLVIKQTAPQGFPAAPPLCSSSRPQSDVFAHGFRRCHTVPPALLAALLQLLRLAPPRYETAARVRAHRAGSC